MNNLVLVLVTTAMCPRHGQGAEPDAPSPAECTASTTTQADMVALFGIEQYPAVVNGMLFHIDTDIKPPFIFERRGTDAYVNGRLIHKGDLWWPSMARASPPPPPPVDPGAPPPGCVWEEMAEGGWFDAYWLAKMAWLAKTEQPGDAARLLADLINRTDPAVHAVVSEQSRLLVSKNGHAEDVPTRFIADFPREPVSCERVKARTASFIAHTMDALTRGALIYLGDYGISRWSIGERSAPQVIPVLLSAQSADDKMRALIRLRFASSLDDSLVRRLVEHCHPDDELRARLLSMMPPGASAR